MKQETKNKWIFLSQTMKLPITILLGFIILFEVEKSFPMIDMLFSNYATFFIIVGVMIFFYIPIYNKMIKYNYEKYIKTNKIKE
jgi:hypothetical protein